MNTFIALMEASFAAVVIYVLWREMDDLWDRHEAKREYAEMKRRLDLIAAMERHPSSRGWVDTDGWGHE